MAFFYSSFFMSRFYRRPWEGLKSGRKCGEVDENMSEHGTLQIFKFPTIHQRGDPVENLTDVKNSSFQQNTKRGTLLKI